MLLAEKVFFIILYFLLKKMYISNVNTLNETLFEFQYYSIMIPVKSSSNILVS